MGGRVSLPEYDENMKRAADIANLTPREVSKFLKYFKKLDKEKKGFIKLTDFFASIEDGRTLYTDTLLELLEIEHDGRINFGDFCLLVTTYCLFEPKEMLKFCFFVFDQDKAGYFEEEELKSLMNALHKVSPGETVKGNVKLAWQRLPFSEYDDRIEFEEFSFYNSMFPRLFGPAQQLQIRMITFIIGEGWWERKKRKLQDIKDEQKRKDKKAKEKEERKVERARQRKIKKKMGIIGYLCCPCLRSRYDDRSDEAAYEAALDKRRRKKEEILRKRRVEELKIKNPVTDPWIRFEKKVEPEKGGDKDFLPVKEERMERKRVERGQGRAERKKARREDPDLNPEKAKRKY